MQARVFEKPQHCRKISRLNEVGKLSWIEDYFQGMALDLWQGAMTPEINEEEAAFVEDMLELDEGAHVLDVPCGTGRLSKLLGQHGYRVTGVDLSESSIARARENTPAGLPVQYICADMRSMRSSEKFDGAFCMGNSFGYYNHEQSQRFLQAVSEALQPGARFVLDTCMAAETFLIVGGQKEWTQVGDIYMLMDNSYDCRESRVDSTFVFMRDGQREHKKSSHWIFTSGEICRMCELSGLQVNELFSSLELEPYSTGASRLLLVATKRA